MQYLLTYIMSAVRNANGGQSQKCTYNNRPEHLNICMKPVQTVTPCTKNVFADFYVDENVIANTDILLYIVDEKSEEPIESFMCEIQTKYIFRINKKPINDIKVKQI